MFDITEDLTNNLSDIANKRTVNEGEANEKDNPIVSTSNEAATIENDDASRPPQIVFVPPRLLEASIVPPKFFHQNRDF